MLTVSSKEPKVISSLIRETDKLMNLLAFVGGAQLEIFEPPYIVLVVNSAQAQDCMKFSSERSSIPNTLMHNETKL